MRALAYYGKNDVRVVDKPEPEILHPEDAIVRVSTAAICGSDLHLYHGLVPDTRVGYTFGHESVGIVEQVGSGVTAVAPGDRVVVPFNISCGRCFYCAQELYSQCENANPYSDLGGIYGYSHTTGGHEGAQAQYVRVPFANMGPKKLPDDVTDAQAVMLADIFPTGYFGAEMAGIRPGDTVAVFGAGPVGLLAAYSAILRGAAEVYVVDGVAERLAKAEEIGAIGIDYTQGEPCKQIADLRKKNPLIQGALRPGEEKMSGVMCGIDAVGYQARRFDRPDQENPMQVIEELVHVVNPTGRIGIVGVFFPSDPGGVDKHAKQGEFQLPLGAIFEKGLSIGTGQTPVKKYNAYLRDLIVAGRARPSFIVSHRLTLEEAPAAYEKFDQRSDGYTKVVLKPEANAPL
jgi:glutathione-independent formaldehyde dehydrogenase